MIFKLSNWSTYVDDVINRASKTEGQHKFKGGNDYFVTYLNHIYLNAEITKELIIK